MVITDMLLAAYAEGNVSQEERRAVRQYLAANPEMIGSVLFDMDDEIDYGSDFENHTFDEYLQNLGAMLDSITGNCSEDAPNVNQGILPMTAMAAQNAIDNLCVIKCEGIALRRLGIEVTDEELLKESEREGWLQPDGTALHNIGRLAGTRQLSVSHRYHCTEKDIREALDRHQVVISVVDVNGLIYNNFKEYLKDAESGPMPNHAVIIEAISDVEVTATDPSSPEAYLKYPLSQFLDAWRSSSNYLIIISDSDEYIPHPINLDDVEVEDELTELREAIAENAHEVWAKTRKDEGWTYGKVRDDSKKLHPDMLPYNLLPESEKEYDRLMAMNTIKLVKKLGWEFRKVNRSKKAAENLENSAGKIEKRKYRCNDCGSEIKKHEALCQDAERS